MAGHYRPLPMNVALRETLTAALVFADQCQREVLVFHRAKPLRFKIAPVEERDRWERSGLRTCYLIKPDGTVTPFEKCPPWEG